jgi:hypothetical protein
MAYNIQLDIPTKSLNLLNQFATSHGCTYKLIQSKASNSSIQFSSDNFDHLEELSSQLLGSYIDEESIKTMVWES